MLDIMYHHTYEKEMFDVEFVSHHSYEREKLNSEKNERLYI